MMIGAITMAVGYLLGLGDTFRFYILAKKYASHGDEVLKQVLELVKEDEQQE